MRKARMMQVRDQERQFSSQEVQRYLQRRQENLKAFFTQLKEDWEQNHNYRLKELENRCVCALNNVGDGHRAAAVLMLDKMKNVNFLQKYAEEARAVVRHRFMKALQKEHDRMENLQEILRIANKRKKIKEVAACLERSIVRFARHSSRSKNREMHIGVANPFKPSTYKFTFFHALPFPNPQPERLNAWKAASAQTQSLLFQKAMQFDATNMLKRRVFLRGQAAQSRALMKKKVKELERELERTEHLEKQRKLRTLLGKVTRPDCDTSTPRFVLHAQDANVKLEEESIELNVSGHKRVRIMVPGPPPRSSNIELLTPQSRTNSGRHLNRKQWSTKTIAKSELRLACDRLAYASLSPTEKLYVFMAGQGQKKIMRSLRR
ncbi:hypothetical protein SELMODRAFT_404784 [Selaginella moellendorffii]|uniref:Uncharacterized protein n=1 Tax=Selaginella moellendorffii TaxID=88036 RepID=D8QXC3_SELML|nr:hypothetical protein SELMODRAFT_404784 [Selaginella moellendorffii]